MDPNKLSALLLQQLALQQLELGGQAHSAVLDLAKRADRRFSKVRLERAGEPYVMFEQFTIPIQHDYQDIIAKRSRLQASQAELAAALFAEALRAVARANGRSHAMPGDVDVALRLICPLWPLC